MFALEFWFQGIPVCQGDKIYVRAESGRTPLFPKLGPQDSWRYALLSELREYVFILREEFQGMQLGEEASQPLFIKVERKEGLQKSRNKELHRATTSDGKMVLWEVHREQIWPLKTGFLLDVSKQEVKTFKILCHHLTKFPPTWMGSWGKK